MGKSKEKKAAKAVAAEAVAQAPTTKVKMKFDKDVYYTDLSKPIYKAGEVYEVDDEGKGMIARWTKRGGVIVEDVPVPVEEKQDEGHQE